MIKITVASGSEKPYYLRKQGMSERGCFIRVGSASEPMPVRMIEDLFSRRIRNSIGTIKSRKKDLTFEQLKIYYDETPLKLNDKFAHNLELLTEDGEFNYAAYLLSDSNGLSIKVAKYSSLDRVDLIEERGIRLLFSYQSNQTGFGETGDRKQNLCQNHSSKTAGAQAHRPGCTS